MQLAMISPLVGWQNFYVIIGTAAATLTGLMFVVITLIAGIPRHGSGEAVGAFATPNVVHFCAALLSTMILSAPWQALWQIAVLLGLVGLAGMIYIIIVMRRARHQTDYQLVLEDWIWHMTFPFASYAAFVVAAIIMQIDTTLALFIIGAAMALFLFIGIHNSWDTVTYLAFTFSQSEGESQR